MANTEARDVPAAADNPTPPAMRARIMPWLGDRKSQFVEAALRIDFQASGFAREVFSHGPLIIAPNHRSLTDTVAIRHALDPVTRARTVTIGARDFFAPAATDRHLKWALKALTCAYVVRTYRVCLINRGDDLGDGVGAIMSALRQNWNVLLFPEGTRTRTGELGRFRSGVAHVARESGAGVLPVWIEGTEGVMAVGAWGLRSSTVRLRAGLPIFVRPSESNQAFLERLRGCLLELAHNGRQAGAVGLTGERKSPVPTRTHTQDQRSAN